MIFSPECTTHRLPAGLHPDPQNKLTAHNVNVPDPQAGFGEGNPKTGKGHKGTKERNEWRIGEAGDRIEKGSIPALLSIPFPALIICIKYAGRANSAPSAHVGLNL